MNLTFPLLILVSCNQVEVDPWVDVLEAPILGGSLEQREAVEETREEFRVNLGQELEIVQIRFLETCSLPYLGCVLGMYDDETGELWLDDDLSVEETGEVLSHELCHAAYHGWGLSLEQVLPIEVADAIVIEHDQSDWAVSGLYSEAFAEMCEGGPIVAIHLAETCDVDPDYVQKLGEYLDGEVWQGPQPLTVTTLGQSLTWEPAYVGDEITVLPARGAIHVFVTDNDVVVDEAWLDVDTGEVIDPVPGVPDLEEDLKHEPDLGGVDLGSEPIGWQAGPGAIRAYVEVGDAYAWRIYAWDGREWSLSGCDRSPGEQVVLAVDDQVITAWIRREDGVVEWTDLVGK